MSKSKLPLVVAATVLLLALVLFGCMVLFAERWLATGLANHFWFLALLLVGVAVALSAFFFFKSYAAYSGKVLGGKLELGGPGVMALAVVVLGFWLVPQAQTDFDFTVLLETTDGSTPLQNTGRIGLVLDADPREEAIGAKGEARFINIPSGFRNRQVAVRLESGGIYELEEGSRKILLTGEVQTLILRPRTLRLQGRVLNQDGTAVASAQVQLGELQGETHADGSFSFPVRADLPETERTITVIAKGYSAWRGTFVLDSNPLIVQLQPQ